MSERVKTVNGNLIKVMTREEINDELIAKGDWPIHYYVPGRTFEPYFITINKLRYRFEKLESVEAFCRKYKRSELINMSYDEICNIIWKAIS